MLPFAILVVAMHSALLGIHCTKFCARGVGSNINTQPQDNYMPSCDVHPHNKVCDARQPATNQLHVYSHGHCRMLCRVLALQMPVMATRAHFIQSPRPGTISVVSSRWYHACM